MNKNELIFIAGPCVMESRQATIDIAGRLKDIVSDYPLRFIFKASFDKANRTSGDSFRGPGLVKGLKILEKVKRDLNLSILSDVHSVEQVKDSKGVLDIIQIPAFLCRQTDLIQEAAKTQKIVNIKKGQFVSPDDVKHIIKKVESTGNKNIFITERGSCFGYNNLVVDFRSFMIMREFGYPVIFDVTHSLQKPSAVGGISGGDVKFAQPLGLAATACGIDGIFMEVHPQPKKALSDKHTSFPLGKLKGFLDRVMRVREAVK